MRESLAPELPANSYVLTHNPGMFHSGAINAGQMSLIVDESRIPEFLGDALHRRRLPALELLVQRSGSGSGSSFAERALEMHPVEMIREYRERDQRFVLYRVKVGGN